MALEIGSLVIEMSANVARLQADVAKATSVVSTGAAEMKRAYDSVRNSLETMGVTMGIGLSAAAFTGFIKGAIEAQAQLDKLSRQTGATVEGLSAIKSVAKLSGTSLDEVAAAMKVMARNMAGIGTEGNKTSQALSAIGLDMGKLKSMKADQAMLEIATALSHYQDGLSKTAALQAIFGRSGANLVEVLDDLAKKGNLQGRVTTEQAQAAEQLERQIVALNKANGEFANSLASLVVPGLLQTIENFRAGREAGLGFWQALTGLGVRGLGESISDATNSSGQHIKELREQIDGLAKRRDFWKGLGFDHMAENVQWEVDQASAKLKYFQGLYADFILKNYKASYSNEGRPGLRRLEFDDAPAKKAAEEKSAYEAVKKSLLEKIGAQEADLASLDKVTAAEREYVGFLNQVTAGVLKLRPAEMADAAVKWDQYIKLSKLNEERKRAAKAVEEEQKAWSQRLADQYRIIDANDAEIKQLQQHNEEIGLSTSQIDALRLARLDDAIAIKTRQLAVEQATGLDASYTEALEIQIEQLRKLRGLMVDGALKQRAFDEQSEMWRSIENTAHQTFVSIFDSGKDAFDRLRDTLKNGLYELLYQMTLKRWMIQLAVSTSGEGTASSVFGQGAVNAVMSGGSSLSGLSNLASLWNGYGNTMGPPVEGSLADYASYLNGMPIGGILSAYSVGGVRGFATGVGSTALAGGVGGLASGAGFMSGATGALASMGPYGWAALAAAAILGMNQGGGTPHTGGTAYSSGEGYQTPRGRDAINAYYADPTADNKMALSDWTKRWSQATADALGPAAEGFAKTFNKIVMANGAAGGYTVGLGFSADGEDPVRARSTILDALGRQVAWTRDFNKLGSDPQKGLELMLTDQVPKLMLSALREVDLGGAINAYLDSSLTASGDLIEKMTAAQVTALLGVMQGGKLDDIIKGMGDLGSAFADVNARIIELNSIYGLAPLFDALGLSIFRVGVDVVKALGGLDAAQNALATYYDRFYSDAEKLAATADQLNAAFAGMNLVMPETKEAFRALVESMADAPTTYAALIQLAPAFADYTDSLNRQTSAATEATAALDAAATATSNLAEITWVSGGDMAARALADYGDLAQAVAGGDFGKQLSLTIDYISGRMTSLESLRRRMVADQGGLSFANTDIPIFEQITALNDAMQGMVSDLAEYAILEAQYAGHGQALLELEKWHRRQQTLFEGNEAALLSLEQAYWKKREDILSSGVQGGLAGVRDQLNDWLRGLDTGNLSPLTIQQKLDETQQNYVETLMQAMGGDQGALSMLTQQADAYLNIAKEAYGFGGDYSAIWSSVRNQIDALANGNLANDKPMSKADADALRAEVVDLREVLARLMERDVATNQAQTDAIVTALDKMTERLAGAALDSAALNTRA